MILPVLRKSSHQPYVQQFAWEIKQASLDIKKFKCAWQIVLKRHDVFRHRFQIADNGEVRITESARTLRSYKFHDCQAMESKKRKQAIDEFKKKDLQSGFNPDRQPLCRFNLFQLSPTHFQLIWTSHHCLFDGRGRLTLIKEFLEAYTALLKKRPVNLSPPQPFSSYLDWVAKKRFKDSLKFWKRQLSDLEDPTPLSFGMDSVRPKKNHTSHQKSSSRLSATLTSKLHRWSKRNQLSINTLVQAAWGIYLWRTSGRDLVVFGAPRACRRSSIAGAADTVGVLVNTVPVSIRFKGTDTVGNLLAAVRKTWVAIRDYENTPLNLIRQASGIRADKPLFQSLVGYERNQLEDLIANNLGYHFRFNLEGFTDIPFVVQVYDGPRIKIEASYERKRFDPGAVKMTVDCLETILKQLIIDESLPLSSVELLSPGQIRTTLRLGSGKKVSLPRPVVHQQFEYIVEKYPEKVAIQSGKDSLTYLELNEKANQLARYLVRQGLKHGSFVGLFLERNISQMVAILAILKSGSAYVPYDVKYPKERLHQIVADVKPACILASTHLSDQINAAELKATYLDSEEKAISRYSKKNLAVRVQEDNPAYIMYTSGSTGKPKGVVIPHRGISRLVLNPNYVRLNSQTRTLQMAPTSFDASTFEIWAPILNGGTCILHSGEVPDIAVLPELIQKYQINTLWLTATLFNLIVDTSPRSLNGISQLLVGGEVLSPVHIKSAQQKLRKTQLINGYGPTENTTFSCCYSIPRNHAKAKNIPLGSPINNSNTYVLDKYLNLLPFGVAGELYVSGKGIALGYHRRKVLTGEKFVQNPFSDKSGDLFYKTGDKVYLKANGDIEFLGRFDDQIKIRGYRIEPGEIQAELIKHPGLKSVYVKAFSDDKDEIELAAFMVKANVRKLNSNNIRSWFSNRVPEYMIPQHFVFLKNFPLTKNGKIDRHALQVPKRSVRKPARHCLKDLTKTQKILLQSWAKILGEKPTSLELSFFDAGGHSLLASNFIYEVHTRFRVRMSFSQFQENSSIRKLADWIDRPATSDTSKDSANLLKMKTIRSKALLPAASNGVSTGFCPTSPNGERERTSLNIFISSTLAA
ncbi:MAG: amino acid adenylation domain-containing protein, partial [Verrucomicrobia bacterium]|nr:amino acid adenylation domain-containing protein [Verrucomicrobiota bacterium]